MNPTNFTSLRRSPAALVSPPHGAQVLTHAYTRRGPWAALAGFVALSFTRPQVTCPTRMTWVLPSCSSQGVLTPMGSPKCSYQSRGKLHASQNSPTRHTPKGDRRLCKAWRPSLEACAPLPGYSVASGAQSCCGRLCLHPSRSQHHGRFGVGGKRGPGLLAISTAPFPEL